MESSVVGRRFPLGKLPAGPGEEPLFWANSDKLGSYARMLDIAFEYEVNQLLDKPIFDRIRN